MEQIEFNKLFFQTKYQPLEYSLRTDANGRHDVIFLDSYLHDARIFLNRITFKKGNLIVPLERTCWELFSGRGLNDVLHGCRSELLLFNVIDYYYSFSGKVLNDGKLPDVIDITDFMMSSTEKQITVKLILNIETQRPEFELTIILKNREGKKLILVDDASSFV